MSALTPNHEQALAQGTVPLPLPVPAPVPHPDLEQIELAAVLHALSDPVRLQIVATVADGREWTCGGLGLPVSKSTCTHHLAVLREGGVIRQRIDGTKKLNSLRREDLDWRFPGLIDAVLTGTHPITRVARS
jgi:DNA-binding transcriptional ArsR family regulator